MNIISGNIVPATIIQQYKKTRADNTSTDMAFIAQQYQCKDIKLTLDTISSHMISSLREKQPSARVDSFSKMESPVGTYAFIISGLSDKGTASRIIKGAVGETYVYSTQELLHDKMMVTIHAEKFDRDTSSLTKSAYDEYIITKRATRYKNGALVMQRQGKGEYDYVEERNVKGLPQPEKLERTSMSSTIEITFVRVSILFFGFMLLYLVYFWTPVLSYMI